MQTLNIHSPFPSYIAVEGPIGTGATRLVKRISARIEGVRLSLDGDDPNPFLKDFYADPERYAFQTETAFLINRFKQQESLQQRDLFSKLILSDYLFDKSRLFASLTLNDHEVAVFDSIFKLFSQQVVQPEMVLYLEAPIQLLEDNLELHDYPHREYITRDYLSGLTRIYYDFFRHYDAVPVLKINLAETNNIEEDQFIEELIERLQAFWSKHGQRRSTFVSNPPQHYRR